MWSNVDKGDFQKEKKNEQIYTQNRFFRCLLISEVLIRCHLGLSGLATFVYGERESFVIFRMYTVHQ